MPSFTQPSTGAAPRLTRKYSDAAGVNATHEPHAGVRHRLASDSGLREQELDVVADEDAPLPDGDRRGAGPGSRPNDRKASRNAARRGSRAFHPGTSVGGPPTSTTVAPSRARSARRCTVSVVMRRTRGTTSAR